MKALRALEALVYWGAIVFLVACILSVPTLIVSWLLGFQ